MYIFIFLLGAKSYWQSIAEKDLYYYQDSAVFLDCGNIHIASVYLFVSDTLNTSKEENQYMIAIDCPGSYKEGFFKKGCRYKIKLNKKTTEIACFLHLPPKTLKRMQKNKNFYAAEYIDKIE